MLTLLFLAAGLSPQSGSQGPGAALAPATANEFGRDFGMAGEQGAFRFRFDKRGAGVWSVHLLDHYVSPAAKRRPDHGPDDYELLISDVQPNVLSLTVEEDKNRKTLFPVALDGADGTAWQVEDLGKGGLRFLLEGNGLQLSKKWVHRPEHRGMVLELQLRNTGAPDLAGGDLFLILRGPSLTNRQGGSMFGNPAVVIGATADGTTGHLAPNAAPTVQDLPLLLEGQELLMAGATNRFFAAFLYPLDDGARAAVLGIDAVAIPKQDDPRTGTKASSVARAFYQLRLPVPAQDAVSTAIFGLYLGPKSYGVFDSLPPEDRERFLPVMDVDLEPPCCGVSVPGGRLMASLLMRLLGFLESVAGSWGLAIVMLTILVRGGLAPLNFRMQKAMRGYAARMAVLKPKMDKLKAQYADDPKAYQQAMIQFQREHKIIPPIGGCLPIFLTMPIYLGLFTALRVAYDLRQQPFIGWIDDLSAPDALFELGIPLVPHFNLLPLLWIAMFLFFQLRTPLPTDPQQRQIQAMMRFMPVLFGIMLFNYASGLMVYMVTSMLWTFAESAVTKRILGPMDPNVQAMAPTPVM